MAKSVEFCYVDQKGVHNKLYGAEEREQLKKDVELVEKLRPNAPIRLLGKHRDTGKPLCICKGQQFAWNDTELTVEITFGGKETFTYRTAKYVDIGDSYPLKTRRGVSYGVVASECKRKTQAEISIIASSIGYSSLVLLQDVIVKEEAK